MALKFFQRLVLADWFFHQVGLSDFDEARAQLFDERLLGETAERRTRFGAELGGVRYDSRAISLDELRQHDEEIARFWRQISAHPARHFDGRAPQLQYFQYLACLWNAIYLRRLFEDRGALCAELNARVAAFNAANPAEKLRDYAPADLDKLAFWSATGSGKTLLMHVHLLQYRAALQRARGAGQDMGGALEKVILLTPSESLSAQHREELRASGLSSAPFSVGALQNPLDFSDVLTLEFSKLGEEAGDKRVAIDSFNGRYLILVDEGHRGLSGTKADAEARQWKGARDRLAKGGFCYEYSATFEQVVGRPDGIINQEYARCIALDYSYRRFYDDGYGKNFRVFNVEASKTADSKGKVSGAVGASDDAHQERYLTGALLSFLAQTRAFARAQNSGQMSEWGYQKPLWVFVGSSVTKETGAKELSDIEAILEFFALFLSERPRFEAHLEALLKRQSGLFVGATDPFAGLFESLDAELGGDGVAAYAAICEQIFGAAGGGTLRLSALKEAEGEIALSVGDAPAWGVINVGKASALLKKCGDNARLGASVAPEKAQGVSLFAALNQSDSSVNVLIGARKFAAGWNSFRVSSLGLMNVGQTEGAQIIQLFGRGVRLRGWRGSLRRSAWSDAPVPAGLGDAARELETLGVFGLKSGYMKVFQEQLEQTGVSVAPTQTLKLATQLQQPRPQLPTLVLPPDRAFERADARVYLCAAKVVWHEDGKRIEKALPAETKAIEADLYPKIAAKLGQQKRAEIPIATGGAGAQTQIFQTKQLDFLDYDALFAGLRRYKNERGYSLMIIERAQLRAALEESGWHLVKAPDSLWSGAQNWVRARALWQETALVLLKRRADLSWGRAKDDYEKDRHELQPFDWDKDPSLVREIALTVNAHDKQWPHFFKMTEAKMGATNFGEMGEQKLNGLEFLDFAEHLYRPLVGGKASGDISVKPQPLNAEEAQFLRDLSAFSAQNPAWFSACNRRIFVLRNKEKEGVGFYEQGGFFPDFLLWILGGDGSATLAFIDPKGLRNLDGPKDRKVRLFGHVKNVVEPAVNLGRTEVVRLRAFLVSNTNWSEVQGKFGWSRADAEAHGIFHQKDEPDAYLEKLLNAAIL